jgi:hypothetical protein
MSNGGRTLNVQQGERTLSIKFGTLSTAREVSAVERSGNGGGSLGWGWSRREILA